MLHFPWFGGSPTVRSLEIQNLLRERFQGVSGFVPDFNPATLNRTRGTCNKRGTSSQELSKKVRVTAGFFWICQNLDLGWVLDCKQQPQEIAIIRRKLPSHVAISEPIFSEFTLSFFFLLFGISLLFGFARNSLFLSVFLFFPKDFRGSHGKKILGFFPYSLPKSKEKKSRAFVWKPFFGIRVFETKCFGVHFFSEFNFSGIHFLGIHFRAPGQK